MKLSETRPNIETSGGMEEQFFSIQDQGMIFDILRNKMYSNPALAICREITCNARDAHREIGKQDQPIQVTIPNTLDPFYRIKDWGPGISPDRMSNIFIKYTASTKRDDNLQTGGFGLGAKTPFSYSDTFTIETVHDGKKYNYACVIDETKVGKLIPMSEEATDLPNGTEIIIPVKAQDYKFFREHTEFVARHWDVQPIIKGDTITFKNPTFAFSGDGWGIATNDAHNYYNRRDMKLVIDGIEYPLDVSQLKGYASTKVLDAVQGCTYLYFGVGELSLSANREAVHLDKPTQEKISEKLKLIIKDFAKVVQTSLDAYPNLWDANVYYKNDLQKTFYDLSFLGKINWRGTPMTYNYLSVPQTEATISEFWRGRYSKKSKDYSGISKSNSHNLSFKDKSKLFINDLGVADVTLTVKHVGSIFEADKNLSTIQVITPVGKTTWDELDKKYNIDKMEPVKLSSLGTKETKIRTFSGARLLVFKFSETPGVGWHQVAYATMEADTNAKKILCILERDTYNASKRRVVLKNKKNLGDDTILSVLNKTKNTSIYGIDSTIPKDKIKEHFEKFLEVDKFVDEKLFGNKTIDYVEIKYAKQNYYGISSGYADLFQKYKDKIEQKDSLFLKNIELNNHLRELVTNDEGLLRAHETLKDVISDADIKKWLAANPDKNSQIMSERVKKFYPLLNHIDYYYNRQMAEPLVHYINLIDEESKATKTKTSIKAAGEKVA